jgi:hypothetical protein
MATPPRWMLYIMQPKDRTSFAQANPRLRFGGRDFEIIARNNGWSCPVRARRTCVAHCIGSPMGRRNWS